MIQVYKLLVTLKRLITRWSCVRYNVVEIYLDFILFCEGASSAHKKVISKRLELHCTTIMITNAKLQLLGGERALQY